MTTFTRFDSCPSPIPYPEGDAGHIDTSISLDDPSVYTTTKPSQTGCSIGTITTQTAARLISGTSPEQQYPCEVHSSLPAVIRNFSLFSLPAVGGFCPVPWNWVTLYCYYNYGEL